jgi:hypothetical protein
MEEEQKVLPPTKPEQQLPLKLDLQPTEEELRFYAELADWQKQSEKTHWVLGKPVGTT